MKTTALIVALGLGTIATLPRTSVAVGSEPSLPSIVDVATGSLDFETLEDALIAADLVDTLNGPGPFTVFAPTDSAFDALPAGLLDSLLLPESKDQLTNVLTYHVLSGAVEEATAITLPFAQALNGQRIPFVYDENVGFFVDGALVTATDIQCSNGVIHVIDAVMIPALNDIVDTADEAGSFNTLDVALRATRLRTPLKDTGPYTVFAPADSAFADLPAEAIQALLDEPGRETLSKILTFHVVPGRIYSDQLQGADLTTLEGTRLRFRDNGTHIGVEGAKIVAENIETTNGVIHVIDKVMMPMP
jgi:transforming growth factor-beta-induced protein